MVGRSHWLGLCTLFHAVCAPPPPGLSPQGKRNHGRGKVPIPLFPGRGKPSSRSTAAQTTEEKLTYHGFMWNQGSKAHLSLSTQGPLNPASHCREHDLEGRPKRNGLALVVAGSRSYCHGVEQVTHGRLAQRALLSHSAGST